MGFKQYHEPADELPSKRALSRVSSFRSRRRLRAINWYEQRMAIEKDKSAYAIMAAVLLQAI